MIECSHEISLHKYSSKGATGTPETAGRQQKLMRCYQNVALAAFWGNTDPRKDVFHGADQMKNTWWPT